MKPFTLFLIGSVLLILGGFVFFKDGFSTAQSQPSTLAEANSDSEISFEVEANFDMANYLNYSTPALSASQERGQTLLFFAATTWCQSCAELEQEIVDRVAEIPSNVTILKVDYDNDQETNQQHAVTSQHTLVLLDESGTEVKRWLGGDFNTLLDELRRI